MPLPRLRLLMHVAHTPSLQLDLFEKNAASDGHFLYQMWNGHANKVGRGPAGTYGAPEARERQLTNAVTTV